MKLYGSIDNRLEEGHNYNDDNLIHVGDDITEYLYTDRTCYYVTRVISQKNIFIKPYHVCADHHKPGGCGHQNWLYFKSAKEEAEYINSIVDEGLLSKDMKRNIDKITDDAEEEWVFRYGHWNKCLRITPTVFNQKRELVKKDLKPGADEHTVDCLLNYYLGLSDEEYADCKAGKTVVKYWKINNGISFGVREYYYDWSF